jgi:DNA replication protein DnaC
MQQQIKDHCAALKLGTRISENYTKIKAKTHAEFLEKLLRLEIEAREVNRKNSLLKSARFDVVKTFENYSFDEIEIPASVDIDEIKTAWFIDKKENLILYGPVGTGKTHLATTIGVEACNQGRTVKFFRTASLVNHLLDAKKK